MAYPMSVGARTTFKGPQPLEEPKRSLSGSQKASYFSFSGVKIKIGLQFTQFPRVTVHLCYATDRNRIEK